MNNRKKTRQLVVAAFLIAIELVLMLTPVGYIPLGPIRATTMHIPVIFAGILLGPKWGAFLGLVFGLTSLATNTFTPTVTSFVFSPFITIGGIHGNFWSLWIVLGPRILLGWCSGMLYRFLDKMMQNQTIPMILSAAINTMLHTILVMGSIWIFFAQPYANAKNMSLPEVWAFILGVITTNGVMETILAAIVVPVLVKALLPTVERLGIIDEQ